MNALNEMRRKWNKPLNKIRKEYNDSIKDKIEKLKKEKSESD
jgi:F0F1-type ATP synthase membrane subunit b/b'